MVRLDSTRPQLADRCICESFDNKAQNHPAKPKTIGTSSLAHHAIDEALWAAVRGQHHTHVSCQDLPRSALQIRLDGQEYRTYNVLANL